VAFWAGTCRMSVSHSMNAANGHGLYLSATASCWRQYEHDSEGERFAHPAARQAGNQNGHQRT
jgi:hypothetical protein